MSGMDSVGVTFVNTVMGRGIYNNVVNIQFGTYLFDVDESSQQVSGELTVSCRLRMDKQCLEQLRDCLNELLTAIAEAEAEAVLDAPVSSTQ